VSDNDQDHFEFCTERHVKSDASIIAAVEERSDNIIAPLSDMTPFALTEKIAAPAMAVLYTKRWAVGRTIRISFMGTVDPAVRAKIEQYATQWLEYANLSFLFVNAGGDIHISTTPGGSWSYVGTDALTIPANEPTMNYGWLKPNSSESEFSRVILHEFGHAMGAIHEHVHPDNDIPWDRPRVYAYYARQGWTQADVDHNIFARYDANQLNMTEYDQHSIMHYAVPEELTIGDYAVGWNTQLSGGDKALARSCYPRP
jgi:serralysin